MCDHTGSKYLWFPSSMLHPHLQRMWMHFAFKITNKNYLFPLITLTSFTDYSQNSFIIYPNNRWVCSYYLEKIVLIQLVKHTKANVCLRVTYTSYKCPLLLLWKHIMHIHYFLASI
jgi:hypothetical protein